MAAQDLSQQIGTAAQSPLAAETDGFKVQAQSVASIIKADQYLAAKAAASLPGFGLRMSKLIGPAQCPAQGPAQVDGDFGFGGFQ